MTEEQTRPPADTALHDLLDAVRADEDAVMRDSANAAFPTGEAKAAEFLDSVDRESERSARIRFWGVTAAIAAAALLIAGTVLWRDEGSASEPSLDDVLLGNRTIELVAPPESVSSRSAWHTFRLRALAPEPGIPDLRIVVYAGENPDGAPIASSPRLSGPNGLTWEPDPEECSDWPATIYWEVFSVEPRALLGGRSSRLR